MIQSVAITGASGFIGHHVLDALLQYDLEIVAVTRDASSLKNYAQRIKVIEFDKESKKIVLSAIAALKEKSDAEIEQYINTYKLERVTVQNIQSAEMGTIDSSEFPIFEVPEPDTVKKEETE